MTTLTLGNNKLSFMHLDSVPNNVPLINLQPDNNDFTRIPSVADKLHALKQLYMPYNKITSFEDSDRIYLARLLCINLDSNPIEYVSPHAFKNNQVCCPQ